MLTSPYEQRKFMKEFMSQNTADISLTEFAYTANLLNEVLRKCYGDFPYKSGVLLYIFD